jgi:hypothetical protein
MNGMICCQTFAPRSDGFSVKSSWVKRNSLFTFLHDCCGLGSEFGATGEMRFVFFEIDALYAELLSQ